MNGKIILFKNEKEIKKKVENIFHSIARESILYKIIINGIEFTLLTPVVLGDYVVLQDFAKDNLIRVPFRNVNSLLVKFIKRNDPAEKELCYGFLRE